MGPLGPFEALLGHREGPGPPNGPWAPILFKNRIKDITYVFFMYLLIYVIFYQIRVIYVNVLHTI